MLLNKKLKRTNLKLLKIWVLHMIIYYPICSFIGGNLERDSFKLQENLETDFLNIFLLSIFYSPLGLWDAFPFFIFMAFTISFILKFIFKDKFFTNYFMTLYISYLIVYIFHLYQHNIFYFVIPSLVLTLIIQMIIFRRDIFKNNLLLM
jgi:hypothetical protein